ncbi:hypothetical protein B0H10DRAFT_2302785 [Mycena sp. CBHHK59/15]|nr:hypothetical protein B0H10DRAFT_2302785 [Mycena sp. CBHHK59/15]
MVALPQPKNGNTELIEGSPMVHLHDSAADVEVFLQVIFDSSYFMPPPDPVDLHAVLGILWLAHKYDVPYLYRHALRHLAVPYSPSSVGDYQSTHFKSHIVCNLDQPLQALEIITTVTKVGELWLPPIVYYRASFHNKHALLSAILRGTDEQVVQRCISAYTGLVRGTGTANSFFAVQSGHSCTDHRRGNIIRLNFLNYFFSQLESEGGLNPLDMWDETAWGQFRVCSDCVNRAKSKYQADMAAFWDQLLSIFDLPPWAELNAMKRAALGEDTQVCVERLFSGSILD